MTVSHVAAHAVPGRHAPLQELCASVLALDDAEEALELLVARARADVDARIAALVLPAEPGMWRLEIVAGEGAEGIWGDALDPASSLHAVLSAHDAESIPSAASPELLGSVGASEDVIASQVVAGEDQLGVLLVATGRPAPAGPAERERIDGLAALVGMALAAGGPASDELDDERGRIARDLHDLAIQELFAVGMELEGLQQAVQTPGGVATDPQVTRALAASVDGIERAVTQIRQIVQSLRRERPQATLTERLHHECALATAGLGFVPSLRLSPDARALDAEVPEEIAEDVVAVVRESLANAARHAHASAVAITVSVVPEGVDRVAQVNVADNGRGIDPAVSRRSGLANMASRARRHQGWVDAIPLEPGTMISWRVTLPPR